LLVVDFKIFFTQAATPSSKLSNGRKLQNITITNTVIPKKSNNYKKLYQDSPISAFNQPQIKSIIFLWHIQIVQHVDCVTLSGAEVCIE